MGSCGVQCSHGSCHLPALLESLGQQGLAGAGTATHVPLRTSYHRREPWGTAGGTRHPGIHSHRSQGTAADTSAPALASLPHCPVAVPLLGLERCPQCYSRWEVVAWSQSRCLGPTLAEKGRWDGPIQPAQHLPLVVQSEHQGLAGGWHFQLAANTPPMWLRGKLRQGQEFSAGVLAIHPCSSLGVRHQAVGEDLGAATTTRGPWGDCGDSQRSLHCRGLATQAACPSPCHS